MDIRQISMQLQEKAISELYEKPSRVQSDIDHLKLWLQKQPHLNTIPSDNLLLSFLRGSKFSLERAKEKIDLFYTLRTHLPEFFSNRDPLLPEIQDILKAGYILPLPTPNYKGERLALARLASFEPSKTTEVALLKACFMIVDILLMEDDNVVIAGVNGLLDMKGGTMEHYTIYTPANMAKFFKLVQHGYPIRVKGLNYINAPSYFEFVLNIFKFALTEKLKNRLKVVREGTDYNFEDIPVKLLPKEYGGEAGSVNDLIQEWKRKVESYRDWFLEDSKYRCNEEKRPGKPRTTEQLFGTDGSFRKLDVD